jgi:type IV secretory pathway ATPase VirB11/archaellum biosynthesis ATPase
MLTRRRLVLSSPRAKKLLWAAVKGGRNIVIVGGIAPRRTMSVPSLRQFMVGRRQPIIVEVLPERPLGKRAKRWHP